MGLHVFPILIPSPEKQIFKRAMIDTKIYID